MDKREREQAELLQQYWSAVAEDVDAIPPEGLDPRASEMVRQLQLLHPPEPDPAFTARLGERLRREAQAQSGTKAPRRRPLVVQPRTWRQPLLAGLATAAVLLLAVVAWQVWSPGGQTVSAAEILQRAEQTAAGSQRFRSFVITEVSETRPAALAGSDDTIRNESTRWYEAPGRWRREVTSTVVGADGEVKSHGGLVSVSDGETIWIHRLRDNAVIIRPFAPAGSGDELGPFPEVTGGLSALLSQVGACYTPRLLGTDTVAGRSAYVVDLGRSRCALGPAAGGSAGEELVEWSVWVDKETFLILKSVQEIDGAVVATSTVTSVQYNSAIEPARFRFVPPDGVRIRDLRQPSQPIATPSRAAP